MDGCSLTHQRLCRRRDLALVVLWVALGVAAGLIVLAYPLFALGAWGDSQPMVVALLASAGICLLTLGTLAPRSRLAARALLHPLALAPLALAAWSLLTAPWAEHPWRSILGPAQNGQGVLWFVAMAAFAAGALMLRSTRWPWRGVLGVAAVSSVIAAVLGLRRIDALYPWLLAWGLLPSDTLYGFNEYLAYPGLALLTAALARRRDGLRNWEGMALGSVAVAVLLVSRNRTAMLTVPLVFAAMYWLRGRLPDGRRTRLLLAAAVAVAGVAPAVASLTIGGAVDIGLGSLWSRAVLLHGLVPALPEGLGATFAGHGWGAVPDQLRRHLPASGIALYDVEWGGVGRDMFHSHNAVFEAFLAAGLPGAVLAALLPTAVLVRCAGRRLWLGGAFALCWALLDGLWFMVAANLPVMMLAAASLAPLSRPLARTRPMVPVGLAVALGLGCLAAAAGLGVQAAQETRFAAALRTDPVAAEDEVRLPLDLRADGHGVADLLSSAVREAAEAGADLTPRRAERLRRLLGETETRAAAGGSPTLSMALVDAASRAALAPPGSPLAWANEDTLAAAWERNLRRLLVLAPGRLDVLAPYLNWLIAHGRDDELQAMIAHARGVDGEHPVVLWFDGVTLLRAPDPSRQAAGLLRMRRALQRGLERFMPVEPEVKAGLAQAPAPGPVR